jgi:hypothetical protein
MVVLRAVVVVGCAGCVYRAGSYADVVGTFPGTRVQLGCLDVAVAMRPDDVARGRVVRYSIGNGCWHPVVVDLASIRAYEPAGQFQLHAYDPKRELAPVRLEAKWMADESIQYLDDFGDSGGSICIDVGGIDASVPRTERWVCLAPGDPS